MNPKKKLVLVTLLANAACLPAGWADSTNNPCVPCWTNIVSCPDFEIGSTTQEQHACFEASSWYTLCADVQTTMPGSVLIYDPCCLHTGPTSPLPFTVTNWTWTLSGNAQPSSGSGSCARFRALSAGSVYARFVACGTGGGFSPCNKCKTTQSADLILHQLNLTLDKEYLGIDLTGPPASRIDQLRADATLLPSRSGYDYSWALSGASEFDSPPGPSDSVAVIREDGEPSSAYRGEQLSVTKFCSATTNFTVIEVDVDMGAPEEEEETKGAFVCLNDDDDNGNGTADKDEAPLSGDDDELLPVTIRIEPSGLPGAELVTLSGIANCYEDRRKQTPARDYYRVDQLPQRLYVEGERVSYALRDRTISAEHTRSGARDQVKYTVLKVESLLPDSIEREVDDGDGDDDTRTFVVNMTTNSGDIVTVTATPNPSIPEANLPSC